MNPVFAGLPDEYARELRRLTWRHARRLPRYCWPLMRAELSELIFGTDDLRRSLAQFVQDVHRALSSIAVEIQRGLSRAAARARVGTRSPRPSFVRFVVTPLRRGPPLVTGFAVMRRGL